jgi:drug/metabolite transporter (DMT)-like permease
VFPLRAIQPSPLAGIVMMLASTGVFVTMNTIIKLIGPGYDPILLTFIRNLVASLVIVPFIVHSGGMAVLRTNRPWMHAARSLGGVVSTILYFYAFVRLPLADVMVISQSVPLIVAMLAAVVLKEHVGMRRWAAICVGFVGVLVTLNPTAAIRPEVLVAIAAAAIWAVTILVLRSLGRTESPYTVVFYYMVSGTVLTALALPWVWRTPPFDVLLMLAVAGVLGAFGQILMTYAFKLADASLVAPFNYTSILWGIGIDLAVWHLAPSTTTLWGAAIITAAGLYLLHREGLRRKSTPPKES